MDGSSIMLKKYQPACIFCDSAKDITVFKGKKYLRQLPAVELCGSE